MVFIQLLSLVSAVGGSVEAAVVFSGVAVSGAGAGSVSVVSGCVAAGAVAVPVADSLILQLPLSGTVTVFTSVNSVASAPSST